MEIKAVYNTDIGCRKAVNQDALIIKSARIEDKDVTMAVLCDGMGGLSCGEVASASFVKRMNDWFVNELPACIMSGNTGSTEQLSADTDEINFKNIEYQLRDLVTEMNSKIEKYGAKREIRLGTTTVMILIINDRYMVMNVGDSRAYAIHQDSFTQITHDQSFIQQQMDRGLMTKEQAEVSPQKSVLLQCVGASEKVVPDFFEGKVVPASRYILCTDGFWRKLENAELIKHAISKEGLVQLTDLVISRGETDNITAIVLSVADN